jgi:putative spermidine/putrescine transport system substrate-binding protein
VIDVGLSFGPQAKGRRPDPALQGLDLGFDPGHAKDAEGYWYGDYYGVMSFR